MRGTVAALTTSHLEPSGSRQVYGGAERYGVALSRLLLEMGYRVEWWQVGDGWVRDMVPGVPIRAIPESRSAFQTMPHLNQIFFEQAADADFAIYFVMFLAYPLALHRSLSVSHGIYWDHPSIDALLPTVDDRAEWQRRLCLAIGGVRRVVSVDTATIDWVRATWPQLAAKFAYVPNFVDLDAYRPGDGDRPGPFRVLFPRRATTVRGIHEAGQAAEWLLRDVPDAEVHFVGRAHDDALERRLTFWAQGRERLYYYWLPPHLMALAYRYADVAWIPTKACEGTSLSCLEAMASGCAVVTTTVGGLSDLVQDGYSGLLVEPTARALREATNRLYADARLRRRLGAHAREVAETFGLDRWQRGWAAAIEDAFGRH